jgi:hypothetical protein
LGKFFPGPPNSASMDHLVFEVITTKLTLKQASKVILPPLLAISSKILIDLGQEGDLLSGLVSTLQLLHPIIGAFDTAQLASYHSEEASDVVASEIAPGKIMIVTGDPRVVKGIKSEGRVTSEVLE